MMLRFIFIIGLILVISFQAAGQLSEGGNPPSFSLTREKNDIKIKKYTLRKLPIKRLLKEDGEIRADLQRIPYSKYREVNINIREKGTVTETTDGKLWRYNIVSKNALGIGLIFKEYNLPEGAKLYIYSSDHSIIYGAYTSKNNKKSGLFAIADLPAKDIIIEYFEPSTVNYPGKLVLGKIGQVYRDPEETALKLEGYVQISCPEADDLQLEKHAVARMNFEELGSGYLCTGALINNTANDATPYFLTANHCISDELSANTLITRFNYETVDCYAGGTSGNMTLSGADLKATYQPSDVTLLLLEEAPPSSYQPYFAGWNALDDTVLVGGGTCIHHPAGETKKASFEFNSIFSYPYQITWDIGNRTPPDSHWLVFFDLGVTAGGSSGAPLFDSDERITGQLHGGGLSYDFYGKLSTSWLGGGTESSGLQSWLDPDSSGVRVLDGYIPSGNYVEAIPMTDLSSPCVNESVQLVDGSLFDPTSWLWSFDPGTVEFLEGTTSSSQNPIVAFLNEDVYNVSLEVSSAVSSDTRLRAQYIAATEVLQPSINLFPDTVIAYCNFDTITVFAKGAVTYEWEVLSGGDMVLFDTSLFDDDHLLIYINDTVVVDSNFSVILALTGTHGNCVETVTDTINFYYPFNDDIENAWPLNMGMNGPFSNLCATVQENEPNPPEGDCNTQETWCGCNVSDTIIDNSVWFTFIAPESGKITINAPGFDNSLGLYAAASAEDILSGNPANYTIIAANDDYFGEAQNYSALIDAAPVTPGEKYWIQVDGSACGAIGDFTIELTDKGYHYLNNEEITAPSADKLLVYPNPASDYLTIQNLESHSELTISLVTADGKEVYSKNLDSVETGPELKISLPSTIPEGIYTLTIDSEDHDFETQVIIMR